MLLQTLRQSGGEGKSFRRMAEKNARLAGKAAIRARRPGKEEPGIFDFRRLPLLLSLYKLLQMQQQPAEHELLEGLKRGDDAAFRKVYVLHFNMIRYLVIKNSGREEDASDVFQDALVVLFEKLNRPDFVLSSSLKTFLYAICRNLWLKRLEKSRRESFVDFEVFDKAEEEEEELLAGEENKAKLRRSLQALGEQCRKVLVLFYFFKKSMEEIAAELNYTNADNAKNQKYKCLQRLKAVYAGAKPARR